jgi:hypothetical protein
MHRLDDVAPGYLGSATRPYLKIDVQGFEHKVLEGAPRLIEKCVGVQCELSLLPIYEGSELWLDMIRRLDGLGFEVHAMQPVLRHKSGRHLHVDAVFIRRAS